MVSDACAAPSIAVGMETANRIGSRKFQWEEIRGFLSAVIVGTAAVVEEANK